MIVKTEMVGEVKLVTVDSPRDLPRTYAEFRMATYPDVSEAIRVFKERTGRQVSEVYSFTRRDGLFGRWCIPVEEAHGDAS